MRESILSVMCALIGTKLVPVILGMPGLPPGHGGRFVGSLLHASCFLRERVFQHRLCRSLTVPLMRLRPGRAVAELEQTLVFQGACPGGTAELAGPGRRLSTGQKKGTFTSNSKASEEFGA